MQASRLRLRLRNYCSLVYASSAVLCSAPGLMKTLWHAGFEGMVQAANRSDMGRRNGGAMLSAQSTERALLTNLLARLRTLDADVYVGHNISAFDLDVLLHRLQHHKANLSPPQHRPDYSWQEEGCALCWRG